MALRMVMDTAIPKEVEDEVRAQLLPLFSGFYTGSKMYKAYYEYLEQQLEERMRRATDFIKIVRSAYEAQTLGPKVRTAFDAFLYLTQTESVGNGFVDMAILLLIAKGLDLHLEPDDEHKYTRHVTSSQDLDSPSLTLAMKLDFLKMNGLPFFENCIDRTLRNRIAHADFEIDADGKFFQLTGKGKKEVDLDKKHDCLINYAIGIERVFREQMAKVTPPPK